MGVLTIELNVVLVVFLMAGNLNFTNALDKSNNDTMDYINYREAKRSAVIESCTTNDDTTGTCMSRFKCANSGGTAKGYCGSYAVCCETNLQCNADSNLKRTIIKNPALFSTTPCVYTIQAYSTNVCQLLIEFQRFELQPPVLTDNVLQCQDHLAIGDIILCGDNTGQHLYLPFNVAQGITEIPLTFNLPIHWAQSVWRLVITQLECPAVAKKRSQSFMPFVNGNNLQSLRTIFSTHHSNDLNLLAPPGCNQFFTELSGNIKSFNYKDDGTGLYFPNMNYVICIKQVPGANMIEYNALKFSMSNEVIDSSGLDEDCHSTVDTPFRKEDYLMIPQSFVTNPLSLFPTYYCGTSLQTYTSVLASAPFIMYFASDGFTDATETGFSINYRVRSIF